MIGSRSWRALMRRNLLYRKRNIVGTLCELLFPILFVFFLVLIKLSVENSSNFMQETIPAYFPNNSDAAIAFSFTDYVTALQAKRVCQTIPAVPGRSPDGEKTDFGITGIDSKGYNWQVPFVKCDSRKCEEDGEEASGPFCEYLALGVAASSDSDEEGKKQAAAFSDYIYERYPELKNNDKLPFTFDFVQSFDSEKDIENYVTSTEYKKEDPLKPKLALAIVFDGTDASIDYNYKIRVNSTGFNSPEDEARPATPTTPPTDKLLDSFVKEDAYTCPDLVGGGPEFGPYATSCTGQYMYNGALSTQRLVNDFIIKHSGAKDEGYFVAEHGVKFAPFPTQDYVENGFYAQIAGFVPLFITLSLLYPVAAMIRYIVVEKELRQKELMKMMSVQESDIGWSWFISFLVFHLITATGAAAMSTQLYSSSSAVLLWIFWEFTMLSIITFTMFLAALFSRASRATLVALLVFFIGYFLTLVVDYETSDLGYIGLVSLHPVGAFAFGLQEIGRLEDAGVGLTMDSITSTDSPSGYTFQNTIQNFIFDFIFWGILSWYVNRVAKADYGLPLPWYFPCTSSYWCPGNVKAPPNDDDSELVYEEGVAVEEVSNTLKEQTSNGRSIELRKLRKVFGEKTAVDGLSMSFYSGQITALLGHNGAGKTTTISMLTGMVTPTEGYATVAGKDIRTDMTGIRGEIGICLQHDCLFPELTVKEHVEFFARIKGMYTRMSAKEAAEKVDASIQDVALSEKRNTLSKNLSGGMKRKLSVAIAFCGDSKTVLLDEPTSGMVSAISLRFRKIFVPILCFAPNANLFPTPLVL
jgi:ATP-binding cassette subfamily A (ABC1) protein 3